MFTVIEIGANHGVDTERLSNGDKHRVFAFEPFPDLFATLQKRFIGYDNMYIVPMAADLDDGWRWFNVADVHSSGLASLHDFSPNLSVVWQGMTPHQHRYRIMTTRLDTFISRNEISQVDYLWIDAQGNDFRVLQSLGDQINRVVEGKCEAAHQVELYTGVNNRSADIAAWLQQHGFEVAIVPNAALLEADVHFRNIGKR
jgi:FkbM family methyltransferase